MQLILGFHIVCSVSNSGYKYEEIENLSVFVEVTEHDNTADVVGPAHEPEVMHRVRQGGLACNQQVQTVVILNITPSITYQSCARLGKDFQV